jgi:hypothetical protein
MLPLTLTIVFLFAWSIAGMFMLTWYHDSRARRGLRIDVTRLQVFLGGPVLWFFEVLAWWHTRAR